MVTMKVEEIIIKSLFEMCVVIGDFGRSVEELHYMTLVGRHLLVYGLNLDDITEFS